MSFQLIPLNLPSYPFRIKQQLGKKFIFDESRKKFLVLTPEEWVRQHVVQYLIQVKKYPRALIQLEGGLMVNAVAKRSDILVYDNTGQKILLVECKAPSVKISQDTFDQIARYNIAHRVQWLFVSNGLDHYCCEIDFGNSNFRFVEDVPSYLPI